MNKENIIKATELIIDSNNACTQMLCRKMGIKFNEAAEIIAHLELSGIIGQFRGSRPREILITDFTQAKKLLK